MFDVCWVVPFVLCGTFVTAYCETVSRVNSVRVREWGRGCLYPKYSHPSTLYLKLFFNKSILLPMNVCDSKKTGFDISRKPRCLIRVCTVCLNYRKLKVNETFVSPGSGPFSQPTLRQSIPSAVNALILHVWSNNQGQI